MPNTPPLQPTPWRTCRVLANRTRLQLFHWLMDHPNQSVSAVAASVKLPVPVASQYLRALEARGLLMAHRSGRCVIYRLVGDDSGSMQGLVHALRLTFQRERAPVETIFKIATAFTHPRRIEIFRLLNSQPKTSSELKVVTGMSIRALVRHVNKLEARGFIASRQGLYAVVKRSDAVGRELAWLAAT